MIGVRLDKLKFIIEEMQLAFFLSTHVEDSFVARTLARHVLIRAKDFIAHARAIRGPLRKAGISTKNFNDAKEAYATIFDEYFKISRDRLGAHVQDIDFGKRLELWNDIDLVKIKFFVDNAKEIHKSLASYSLSGYLPITDLSESVEKSLQDILRQFQKERLNNTGVEIGEDSLALTRNNTVASLNMTPVHARAGQLALIRRWMSMGSDLLNRFSAHPQIVRILKARIVTDLVSFCDCLVTRRVVSGSPQEMDGLDKLVVASGQSAAPIDCFISASNFQTELQTARSVRDTIGAHLEIDQAQPIAFLFANLDAYDLSRGLDFYQRLEAVFIKTCRSILFLRMYIADGQRLYGVLPGRQMSVPYAENCDTHQIIPPEPPPINDEDAYQNNLALWLDGDESQKSSARQFFWGSFSRSQLVETMQEVECFGSSQSITSHEFRKVHQFLSSILSDSLSDSDFRGLLDLILSCRNGWPYPLAEILVRYGQTALVFRQWLICYALGEIGSAPHSSVLKFLENRARSKSWPIRFHATLALYKIFVKNEGIFRINHRGQTRTDYDAVTNPLLAHTSRQEQLILLLSFASVLSGPNLGSPSQPFQDNYIALQSKIEKVCLPFFKGDDGSKRETLNQLIHTNDYVGVCGLLAIALNDNQDNLRAVLLDSCCNGSIITAGHDQASRHLAMCFLMKKEHKIAFELVQKIASRNPDWVDIQILGAEILGETLGAEEAAAQKITNIYCAYKLSDNDRNRLVSIEAELEKRKNNASQA